MKSNLPKILAAALLIAAPAAAQELHAFWQQTLAQLAREPMEAKSREAARGFALPGVSQSRCAASTAMHFRALWPCAGSRGESPAKPWPAIVSPPGYGGLQQSIMLSECRRGNAILQVYPRSQGESAELWKIDGPDKLTWHVGNPEGAYYQGAYADITSGGIDYLLSRSDVDANRIALCGTEPGRGDPPWPWARSTGG